MKIIDKNGKIFGRLNLVDLFVIILVIAAVVLVGAKFKKNKDTKTADVSIEYKVKIERVREETVDALKQNDKDVVNAETKKLLGNITKVEKAPARELVRQTDGSYTIADYDNRYDVTVTLKVDGTDTPQGYYSYDGALIVTGENLGISNGFVQTFGEIISVDAK